MGSRLQIKQIEMRNMYKKLAVIVVIGMFVFGFSLGIRLLRETSVERGVEIDLFKVKVAVVYERVTDRKVNRSVEDVILLLKEVNADFIFRGWWRWTPCPNKCEDLPSLRARIRCEFSGYSYEFLEEAISKIKQEIPDIIFCGAIPVQIITRDLVWNPKTQDIIKYPETWELALDPGKWGLNFSKEKLQCMFGKTHLWVPRELDCNLYNPEEAPAYFPDITNPKFQELVLSWAERQIDAGADAIWIDMLFKQAAMLYRLTEDFDHPAVRESYEAACTLVDRIHKYGEKKGKQVLVGSWPTAAYFPYPPPDLDFVTLTPSSREVREMKFDEERWDEMIGAIKEKFGEIPIIAFIDWASTKNTPLGQFSQVLTKEQQNEFLRIADEFFSKKGIIFAYPIHGGWMGNDAEILSFGISKVYDALAPEFQTYNTIKELAREEERG